MSDPGDRQPRAPGQPPRRWSGASSGRWPGGALGRWPLAMRQLPGGWWLDGLLLAGFVALTVALAARTPLLHVDVAVADWCDAHRPAAARIVARGLNYLGQGTPLTLLALALAGWRASRCRSVRPLLVVAAAFVLTYCTIGPVKALTDRTAPSASIEHREWLFRVASGMSYPSGHVGNALVWYVALSIVLVGVLPDRLLLVARTVPVGVVIATTTYLGWHWITDDVAGLLLGLVLARVLLRLRWDELPLPGALTRAGWAGPAGLRTALRPGHGSGRARPVEQP